jgi:hypothetical protein
MISPDDVSAPNYRSLTKMNRWFLVYRDPIIDPDFGEKIQFVTSGSIFKNWALTF